MVSENTAELIAQDLLGIKNELRKLAEGIKVAHIQVEQRYKIVVERAASTKGVDGFKIESNGDNLDDVEVDAAKLYTYAKILTQNNGSKVRRREK